MHNIKTQDRNVCKGSTNGYLPNGNLNAPVVGVITGVILGPLKKLSNERPASSAWGNARWQGLEPRIKDAHQNGSDRLLHEGQRYVENVTGVSFYGLGLGTRPFQKVTGGESGRVWGY